MTTNSAINANQQLNTTSNPTFASVTLSTGAIDGYVLVSNVNGLGTWTALSGIGVTSAQGTANQVLVNGVTGSPQTGAITLSTPQSIGITSSPTFNIVTLSNLTSGSVIYAGTAGLLSQDNGYFTYDSTNHHLTLTGTYTVQDGSFNQQSLLFSETFSPSAASTLKSFSVYCTETFNVASGKTVTAAGSILIVPNFVNGGGSITTWYGVSAGSNYSGNPANVVNAYSGYFGNPVFGSSSSVALYADNLAVGFGTTSPPSLGAFIRGQTVIGDTSDSGCGLLTVKSTSQGFLPPRMTNTQRNAIGTPVAGLIVYSTTDNDLEFYNGSSWVGSTISGVTTIAGTANQISLSAATGSVVVSLPVAIITPGTLSVTGSLISGSTTTFNATTAYNVVIASAQTAVDGSSFQIGLYNKPTLNPTNGATTCFGIYNTPIFIAPIGKTITNAYGMQIAPILSSNVGTISVAVTLHLQAGSAPGGTVNNNYTFYCQAPTSGVQKYTAYFDPGVGIGDVNSVNSSAALLVSSTTQGFLPPSMTTTEKNSISGPASGLLLYDNVLNDMQYYNGASWISTAGVISIAGTANQIIASASTGAVTLSTPQNIATTSSPTFAALTLTAPLTLANGGTNFALTANNGGIVWSNASQLQILAGTATANKILLSGATATPSWSTSTIPTSAGATANKVLLSDGTNYVLSTPTFPNASATSGKTIRSDGTNWIASTATLSDAPSTALKWLRSDGTNWITSTSTHSDTPGTAGKVVISDGTNWITSTPTYPNSASSTGTILRADGTNWVATTSTYPNTNAISTLLYASSANVMSALATANQGVLTTGTTGIPVITAIATNGQIIIGSTAGAPAAATITAGTGITVTNASNSITIAASATSGPSLGLTVATASFMNGF